MGIIHNSSTSFSFVYVSHASKYAQATCNIELKVIFFSLGFSWEEFLLLNSILKKAMHAFFLIDIGSTWRYPWSRWRWNSYPIFTTIAKYSGKIWWWCSLSGLVCFEIKISWFFLDIVLWRIFQCTLLNDVQLLCSHFLFIFFTSQIFDYYSYSG